MSALFVLIIISILVAFGFLFAFFWATGSGQFEDDYTPAVRMLFDDKAPVAKDKSSPSTPSSNHKK
ncbi:cbb3-type cytochrome oxidase assembly protein CcoS [Litoribacter ruber]|uniref:Cbb3-type cytochrome oxidase assembly protein CcoS n=1 Tax=Litoribacter ruber TaxID=702568 RepID=A0AAP2G4A7_9BACT|nr:MULTISPECIES: cbb3-type cytochrome oxidase assembly protein CcoS [Litoribacter]MBS9523298.1 cbb3-type cytochrome oxidase assembly protein CcoS [Litoribacter alkaliphilus]MBT0810538.1 cbb3-type cytochrome oxidase assembly protein CcoS [Litoribacter ruber]